MKFLSVLLTFTAVILDSIGAASVAEEDIGELKETIKILQV